MHRHNGGADAELLHKIFFDQPVLRGLEDFLRRDHRTARRQHHGGGRRHVLEFIGDDVDVVGEQLQRLDIGIFGAGRVQHHVERRRIRVRRKHLTSQAKPRRRHRQHAAQLPAAENSDGVARLQPHWLQLHFAFSRHADPSGRSATASVCCLRQAASRTASAASFSASTLAASSAALIAPALPIASVPTGMPAGICTIE
jgi:hypothetical protein